MKFEFTDQAALIALKEYLEKVPFIQIEQIDLTEEDNQANRIVKVHNQGRSLRLLAEIKNNGQPRMARMAVYQLKECLSKETDAYGIFIAPYISSEAGKICEEAGIGYLDLAGNCLISFETIYIRQMGAPNPHILKRDLRSLYSPKAERILRVLLNDPKNNWKMVDLAQSAKVSLGQVANVKKMLLDREWLIKSLDGISLTNPAALLDEWGQAYNFRRNEVYDCYALNEILEIEAQLADTCRRLGLQFALTGFSSAARIAPKVRYQKASAFIKGDASSLIEALGWKTVTSGSNVSLVIPYDDGVFYGAKDINEITIASPVQTYLDLQDIRGRGQEAAQAVRKEIAKAW